MIENCKNNAKIKITGECHCGGIVAMNRGIIYRCINNGEIIAIGESAGGIAGGIGMFDEVGFIIECINNGDISASSYTCGGIVPKSGSNRKSWKRIYM